MASNNYIRLFSRLTFVRDHIFCEATSFNFIPSRSTFILKRRYPVALVKKGEEDHPRKFKARNYIYDMIENTETKKQGNIKVVLRTYIEGIGQEGDVVEVRKNVGYHKLLLPGLADYATEEDITKAAESQKDKDSQQFSSKTAPLVASFLEKMVLGVVMNKETPWTLEPWHVKVAFRKAGVNVPEEAIKIPSQPINGPDLNLEHKDFVAVITINKRETAKVRCRIHHWSTNIQDRLPYAVNPWADKTEAIFKEDEVILEQLPLPSLKSAQIQADA